MWFLVLRTTHSKINVDFHSICPNVVGFVHNEMILMLLFLPQVNITERRPRNYDAFV